jgi:hypothetical protein
MIGIDVTEEKIMRESIWTQDSQVEQSLFGGLLAMVMDEEFAVLDDFIEGFVQKNSLTGWRQEAINNVGSTGYTTSYYFIHPMPVALSEPMEKLNGLYFENPSIDTKELKEHFDKEDYNEEHIIFSIQLYMSKEGDKPDKALFQKLVSEFKELEGAPRGNYQLSLHDNYVNKLSASGSQDNSLKERNVLKD